MKRWLSKPWLFVIEAAGPRHHRSGSPFISCGSKEAEAKRAEVLGLSPRMRVQEFQRMDLRFRKTHAVLLAKMCRGVSTDLPIETS